jgi:hypothetical protein
MNLPSFPNVDLFSAGINALNGVLVARNPSHDRGYSMAGLLVMAFFGHIGGGRSDRVGRCQSRQTAILLVDSLEFLSLRPHGKGGMERCREDLPSRACNGCGPSAHRAALRVSRRGDHRWHRAGNCAVLGLAGTSYESGAQGKKHIYAPKGKGHP